MKHSGNIIYQARLEFKAKQLGLDTKIIENSFGEHVGIAVSQGWIEYIFLYKDSISGILSYSYTTNAAKGTRYKRFPTKFFYQ